MLIFVSEKEKVGEDRKREREREKKACKKIEKRERNKVIEGLICKCQQLLVILRRSVTMKQNQSINQSTINFFFKLGHANEVANLHNRSVVEAP